MKNLRFFLGTFLVLGIGVGLFSCGGDDPDSDPTTDPCLTMDCGIHGNCEKVTNTTAKCVCDQGWTGEFCDQEIVINDTTDNDDTTGSGKTSGLSIIVRKKFSGVTLNTDGCFAIIGKDEPSMRYFELFYSEELQKIALKNENTLKDDGAVIATAYSTKDSGKDGENDAGLISFDEIPTGTYYLHVLDPDGDKYVAELEISDENKDQEIIAHVEPLISMKFVVSITSITGSELNETPIRVYGSGNDTLIQAQQKKVEDVAYEALYKGVTGEVKDEMGNTEAGAFYLWNIPKRQYNVLAYSELYYDQYGKQAYLQVDNPAKNALNKFRVCWKGCN